MQGLKHDSDKVYDLNLAHQFLYHRNSFLFIFTLGFTLGFMNCQNSAKNNKADMESKKIEIQAHRGCRGLLPENSIPAFKKALTYPIDVLELDVIISADSQVVVSHEPWLSEELYPTLFEKFKSDSLGTSVKDFARYYNLFLLNYDQIKAKSFGEEKHGRFPEQTLLKTYKPLLSEVFEAVEIEAKKLNRPVPKYNIELKSDAREVGLFYPNPKKFCQLAVTEIRKYLKDDQYNLQSFDYEILKELHRSYPEIKLSLLIEEKGDLKIELNRLGFTPEIYSPDYTFLSKEKIEEIHSLGMQVIPWTVNEVEDMKQLKDWGVDGLITDYPDRAR